MDDLSPSFTTAPAGPGLLAGPVVGTTEIIVLALVLGAITLAGIAASLVKSLGHRAIDKADPVDVPHVLSTLGAWIPLFIGFLPGHGRGAKLNEVPADSAPPPSVVAAGDESNTGSVADA